MTEAPARASIRARLLVFLATTLLLLLTVAAGITYWVAQRAAHNAYDRSLVDPAIDIAQHVRVEDGHTRLDLPPQAQEALLYDQADRMIFQVRDSDGAVIAGVDDLPALPEFRGTQPQYRDAIYQNVPVRIVGLRLENNLQVQVAETLQKRNRLVWEILSAELVTTLLIAIVSIAAAWVGVAHALAPLARIRDELLRRSPKDLQPIADAAAPVEIAPVVDAFNRLLGQVREANAIQQRFLANAAHQLRTPLAGLQMHLELVLRRQHVAEVRAELERMQGATARAGHLTNQLLALAKVESKGGRSVSLVPVDLHAILEAAAQRWVPQAIARNIDLGFSLEHATVLGDPMLLPELLDNLVDNALRYTPANGTVNVNCGCDAGTPYLSV
jgi:two-component system sensor histidine kinase TctE